MKNRMLAYILPIVLVIGTAFGAGLVVGYPCEAETDVTVEVEYVPPYLDLCNSYIVCQSDDDMPYEVDCDREYIDIVNMKVYSPHHQEVEVYIEIESEEYGEGDEGDALRYKAIEETITVTEDDYEDGEDFAWVHYNTIPGVGFELGDYPFWVAGLWTLRGHLYVDGEKVEDSEDEKPGFFEVNKCCDLDVTESLSGEGKPGDTVTMDGEVFTLSANYAWQLSAEDFYLYDEDDVAILTGSVEYEEQSTLTGAPADGHTYEFEVSVFIEVGTAPETYSGTANHILSQQ